MYKNFCAAAFVFGLAASPALAQDSAMANWTAEIQAEQKFSVDLYGKLAAQPGNFVFSPYSISTALLMTGAGAKGQTAVEMSRVLHTQGISEADLLQAVKNPAVMTVAYAGLQFHSANALWVAPRYPFKPDFVQAAQQDFGAAIEAVDFADAQAAADKINGWVADETAGKIQNLVDPGALNTLTCMVLTNAVYFKSSWSEKFLLWLDTQQKFHLAPGRDETVTMMHMQDDFSLTQASGLKILSIPYSGDASMVVILPNAPDGLKALEAGLNAAELNNWLAAEQNVPVMLALPKFKQTSEFDVNDVLKTLGMSQAFTRYQADFTGIADVPDDPLYISDVLHKAYIDVDENGTEAAAATAVMVTASGGMEEGPPPPPPVPFIADHPFLYLIRANSSGAILFMGRVDDPGAD